MTTTAVIPGQRQPSPAERWELVTRIQQGDREAFAELYRLYQPTVYRVVYRRVPNPTLAEDITQDVFVRALRSLDGVSWQGRDIGAWLVTVARNLVMDHYKSGRFRREAGCGIDAAPARVDDDRRGDPEQVTDHNVMSAALDGALGRLTAGEREVIALRFGAGLSLAETAAVLGKREGAVKAAQFRACQALRRHLTAAGVTSC